MKYTTVCKVHPNNFGQMNKNLALMIAAAQKIAAKKAKSFIVLPSKSQPNRWIALAAYRKLPHAYNNDKQVNGFLCQPSGNTFSVYVTPVTVSVNDFINEQVALNRKTYLRNSHANR